MVASGLGVSILPFWLDPAEPNRIRLADLSPLGLPIERTWQVVEADSLTYRGDLADTRQAEAV